MMAAFAVPVVEKDVEHFAVRVKSIFININPHLHTATHGFERSIIASGHKIGNVQDGFFVVFASKRERAIFKKNSKWLKGLKRDHREANVTTLDVQNVTYKLTDGFLKPVLNIAISFITSEMVEAYDYAEEEEMLVEYVRSNRAVDMDVAMSLCKGVLEGPVDCPRMSGSRTILCRQHIGRAMMVKRVAGAFEGKGLNNRAHDLLEMCVQKVSACKIRSTVLPTVWLMNQVELLYRRAGNKNAADFWKLEVSSKLGNDGTKEEVHHQTVTKDSKEMILHNFFFSMHCMEVGDNWLAKVHAQFCLALISEEEADREESVIRQAADHLLNINTSCGKDRMDLEYDTDSKDLAPPTAEPLEHSKEPDPKNNTVLVVDKKNIDMIRNERNHKFENECPPAPPFGAIPKVNFKSPFKGSKEQAQISEAQEWIQMRMANMTISSPQKEAIKLCSDLRKISDSDIEVDVLGVGPTKANIFDIKIFNSDGSAVSWQNTNLQELFTLLVSGISAGKIFITVALNETNTILKLWIKEQVIGGELDLEEDASPSKTVTFANNHDVFGEIDLEDEEDLLMDQNNLAVLSSPTENCVTVGSNSIIADFLSFFEKYANQAIFEKNPDVLEESRNLQASQMVQKLINQNYLLEDYLEKLQRSWDSKTGRYRRADSLTFEDVHGFLEKNFDFKGPFNKRTFLKITTDAVVFMTTTYLSDKYLERLQIKETDSNLESAFKLFYVEYCKERTKRQEQGENPVTKALNFDDINRILKENNVTLPIMQQGWKRENNLKGNFGKFVLTNISKLDQMEYIEFTTMLDVFFLHIKSTEDSSDLHEGIITVDELPEDDQENSGESPAKEASKMVTCLESLIVTNMPSAATKAEVLRLFSKYGKIINVTMKPAKEENGGRSSKLVKDSDSEQLFVGNIPKECNDYELTKLFSKYGRVVDVKINPRGSHLADKVVYKFGFIVFDHANSVQSALEDKPIMLYGTHRLNIDEKKVKVPRETKKSSIALSASMKCSIDYETVGAVGQALCDKPIMFANCRLKVYEKQKKKSNTSALESPDDPQNEIAKVLDNTPNETYNPIYEKISSLSSRTSKSKGDQTKLNYLELAASSSAFQQEPTDLNGQLSRNTIFHRLDLESGPNNTSSVTTTMSKLDNNFTREDLQKMLQEMVSERDGINNACELIKKSNKEVIENLLTAKHETETEMLKLRTELKQMTEKYNTQHEYFNAKVNQIESQNRDLKNKNLILQTKKKEMERDVKEMKNVFHQMKAIMPNPDQIINEHKTENRQQDQGIRVSIPCQTGGSETVFLSPDGQGMLPIEKVQEKVMNRRVSCIMYSPDLHDKNMLRMLVLEEGLFHPPEDGWGSREYLVKASKQPSQINMSLSKAEPASLPVVAPPQITSTGKNPQTVVKPEDSKPISGLFDFKPATTKCPLIPQLMMPQPPVMVTKPNLNPHPPPLLPDPTFGQFISWAQPQPPQFTIPPTLNLQQGGAGAVPGSKAGCGAIAGAFQYTMPYILSLLPSSLPFRLLPGETWPQYQARLYVVVDSYRLTLLDPTQHQMLRDYLPQLFKAAVNNMHTYLFRPPVTVTQALV